MAGRHGVEPIDLRDHDDLAGHLRGLTGGRGPDSVVDAVGMEAHGSSAGKVAHALVGLLPDATWPRGCRRSCVNAWPSEP